MTYKLNPALSKIKSPIVLIADSIKTNYADGNELVQAVFEKKYAVESIRAVENHVEITLVEPKTPDINWCGEEPFSFF